MVMRRLFERASVGYRRAVSPANQPGTRARLKSWWRGLTPFERVRVAFAAVVFLGLGLAMAGLSLYLHLSHAGTGEDCKTDGDCRSRKCLAVSGYQPVVPDLGAESLLGPGQGLEHTRAFAESWNESFDPLAPSKDGLRPVEIVGRYCTEACENDDDCPASMRCGQTKVTRVSALGAHDPKAEWITGKASASRRSCVRR